MHSIVVLMQLRAQAKKWYSSALVGLFDLWREFAGPDSQVTCPAILSGYMFAPNTQGGLGGRKIEFF
jgi:hypothetical protein